VADKAPRTADAKVEAVAGAITTIAPAGDCDQELSQPFTRWGDPMWYTLMPGGDFEGDLDGWALRGGATVVEDNEPWKVTADTDGYALHLPAGASVVTPAICAGITHPTARFFAKGVATDGNVSPFSGARVDMLYPDEGTLLTWAPLGLVMPTADWQPTLPILTGSGLPGVTGNTLALRITATGGPITIDDVYVDPMRR
jgi:hypothetical protein